jgi:enoyl-CoA hydratase/carnithine racemase
MNHLSTFLNKRLCILYTLDSLKVNGVYPVMATPSQREQSTIALEVSSNGVAIARIVQPSRRNAMNLSMWHRLYDVFEEISVDRRVRCVVLTGEGSHFCAGADISEFDSNRDNATSGKQYDEVCDRATLSIKNCRKPVIAAISGVAVGGGLSLALACDLRVGDRTARTGIPAGRLGLVYGIVDCSLLAARIGITRALEILFSARIYDANDSMRLGLIDRLDEKSALAGAVNLAEEIAATAPLSVAGHKMILNAIMDGTVQNQKQRIQACIDTAFESRDYSEGRAAFAERRPPKFTGS